MRLAPDPPVQLLDSSLMASSAMEDYCGFPDCLGWVREMIMDKLPSGVKVMVHVAGTCDSIPQLLWIV